MFNHNRGLWGYSGTALDGELLTIQSTGMGGPSAAIVISELIELGARSLIRVGTCGALRDDLGLGELIAVPHALAADGTSRALGAGERVQASATLTEKLQAAGEVHVGPVVSSDLFYEQREGIEADWVASGAVAVEMETATLFALAPARGAQAAALLIVADRLFPTRARIDADQLKAAEHRAGGLALGALGTVA
jgi:uridine phosphorylase